MGNYNFRKDMAVAKETEKDVASLLIELYGAEIKDYNSTISHDIQTVIKGKDVLFEVKEDFMCGATGNVAVEYSCRGKDSGIAVSNADYYIYKIHLKDRVDYMLLNAGELKRAIKARNYFRTVNGGDKGSNSLCYLFKYQALADIGTVIYSVESTGEEVTK